MFLYLIQKSVITKCDETEIFKVERDLNPRELKGQSAQAHQERSKK
jgi:hypothetical protein